MADVNPVQLQDYGSLLTSFPRNQAAIANTQANTAYINGPQTAATNASAGLTGAQTGLVQQQTQKTAFEVQMIRDAMNKLHNMDNSKADTSGEQAQADPTETGVASTLNTKFGFVDPMGPKGLQQYINATAWVNPAEAQRASDMRDKLVSGQTMKNQAEANDIFQTASTLQESNAGLGTLMTTTHPGSYLNNVGKAIASMQDKTPEEKDQMARDAISAAAKYSHQYTGRPLEQSGDQFVDKATAFPVHAPTIGLTSEQKVEANKWLNTPQTVTIDNRATTIKPKDLGIKSPQDLLNNKSVKFSSPPPDSMKPQSPTPTSSGVATSTSVGTPLGVAPSSSPGGQGSAPVPTKPMTPVQARVATSDQGGAPIPNLNTQQSDFVKTLPPGIAPVRGNSTLNADDMKQRDIYREQTKALAASTNTDFNRAQDSLAQIKRVNALLATPGITLGPGSQTYSQARTVLENWTGTPSGQAGAFQVLSKVLNASEMNDLLQQFHSEGAQVRLGAYESRLIMEKLAANPNLTKGAIQQMLQWQSSDAQYTMDKAKTAGAAMATGRDISNFDKQYGDTFKKQDIIDSTLNILHPQPLKLDAVKGKTYTSAEVSATAAKRGIPLSIFQDKLTKAGAIVK